VALLSIMDAYKIGVWSALVKNAMHVLAILPFYGFACEVRNNPAPAVMSFQVLAIPCPYIPIAGERLMASNLLDKGLCGTAKIGYSG
jgi:hypothetical protein